MKSIRWEVVLKEILVHSSYKFLIPIKMDLLLITILINLLTYLTFSLFVLQTMSEISLNHYLIEWRKYIYIAILMMKKEKFSQDIY